MLNSFALSMSFWHFGGDNLKDVFFLSPFPCYLNFFVVSDFFFHLFFCAPNVECICGY